MSNVYQIQNNRAPFYKKKVRERWKKKKKKTITVTIVGEKFRHWL